MAEQGSRAGRERIGRGVGGHRGSVIPSEELVLEAQRRASQFQLQYFHGRSEPNPFHAYNQSLCDLDSRLRGRAEAQEKLDELRLDLEDLEGARQGFREIFSRRARRRAHLQRRRLRRQIATLERSVPEYDREVEGFRRLALEARAAMEGLQPEERSALEAQGWQEKLFRDAALSFLGEGRISATVLSSILCLPDGYAELGRLLATLRDPELLFAMAGGPASYDHLRRSAEGDPRLEHPLSSEALEGDTDRLRGPGS